MNRLVLGFCLQGGLCFVPMSRSRHDGQHEDQNDVTGNAHTESFLVARCSADQSRGGWD